MKQLKDNVIVLSESCLSYDTKVLTLEYGILPIGKIVEEKIDCCVYTRDIQDSIYIQRIEQWHNRGKQKVFEYTLENGSTIKATKDHKFMTSDGKMLPIDEIFEKSLDLLESISRHSYVVDGYNFKSILPDSYICSARYCNECEFDFLKLDSHYIIKDWGCTEGYCYEPVPLKNYELCFNNWMLSDYLRYDDYSLFVNNCINGYRNITYVKQQQAIDNSFTIEKAQTPKHTYIALNNAIQASIQLEKSLKKSGRFNEKQLLIFSRYIEFCRFPNYFNILLGMKESEKEEIEIIKDIFDYVETNLDINNIITGETIKQFRRQYKQYYEDLAKYNNQTTEERQNILNKLLIEAELNSLEEQCQQCQKYLATYNNKTILEQQDSLNEKILIEAHLFRIRQQYKKYQDDLAKYDIDTIVK